MTHAARLPRQPVLDLGAARTAARELVRLSDRRIPTDVAGIKLPVAMEILDQCGGDPLRAMYVLAEVVNTELARPGPVQLCLPTLSEQET